jgi:hypothetical protein
MVLSEAQLADALAALNMAGQPSHASAPKDAPAPPNSELALSSEPAAKRRGQRRFSRGTSLSPCFPGGGGSSGSNSREEQKEAHAEDFEESPLPSGVMPYVPSEVSYLNPIAPGVSTGSNLRLIAFDFDQTLAATHLFFRLKNVQSRARASKQHDGRPGPSLVKLLLSGAVPFEEIWGTQVRLKYLKAHLQELFDLGVYMVVITKGAGRLVDVALQLAGLRRYFQAIIDPKTSMGAKLMTVQVLMNTALSERLRPHEAALVDDELKNLIIDISDEEVAALPPSFYPAEIVHSPDGMVDDLETGNLVGPDTVCRLMRVEQGVKEWQLWQLICAAAGSSRFA